MSKLVIFDVDGTLIDSQAHIVAGLTEAFRGQPFAMPSRSEMLSIVGLSLDIAIARLAPDADAQTVATMVEAYKDSFVTYRQKHGAEGSPLYEGAERAIKALAARDDVQLAIATGKSRRGLNAMLDYWSFSDVFISLQCADDHPSKPHPSMVHTCLADANVAPQDAVVIGDTSFDMEMAVSARAQGLGVNWGYHDEARLLAAGAARVVHSYADVIPALDDLWGM